MVPMLFRKEFLDKIKNGQIRLAFRRWKKLSIKSGGQLKTAIGIIEFKKITPIKMKDLTANLAAQSGFSDLDKLLKYLASEGTIYKIEFDLVGPDPRLKLREENKISKTEMDLLVQKLHSLDTRGAIKNWVIKTLQWISENPGTPSRFLASNLNVEQLKLKVYIRKLKNLGLTISLGTGYAISARGKVVLKNYSKASVIR